MENSNKKKNYVWAVFAGEIYSEGYLDAVYDKKQDAVEDIKAKGYKYNKGQDLYLNTIENRWYRIDEIEHNHLN